MPTAYCESCKFYHSACPFRGMTSSNSDEPLEGNMLECKHFLPNLYDADPDSGDSEL
jgi:hypothetical protein